MNSTFKNILKLLVTAIVLFAPISNIKAQYIYTLVDSTDSITLTYNSATLITSDLSGVSPTTSTSSPAVVSLNFVLNIPVLDQTTNQDVEADILDVNFASGGDYYDFAAGAFDAPGTYQSLDNVGSYSGELTVSEVTPEPSTYALLLFGLSGLFFARKFIRSRSFSKA